MNTRRILLVSPNSPFSARYGSEQRSALMYEALTQLGETDVLMVEPTNQISHTKPSENPRILARVFWKNSRFGFTKYRPDAVISDQLAAQKVDFKAYDLIVSRYLNPICKLRLPKGVPTIVDLDDWGKTYGRAGRYSLKSISSILKNKYASWLAKKQLGRFDGFFFVSRRDRAREHGLLSEILPNIPFSPPSQALPETAARNILLVGALWYGPNFEGVNHFLKCCWPGVRAALPDATLTLVGEASPAIRNKWGEEPGVNALGFVDNIQDAYRAAAFSIAPIYFGGGTNIKVLESLAFGRACITTPHCAEAFKGDLVAKGGLSVAHDDAEFTDLCIAMLGDSDRRRKQAMLGFDAVNAYYNRVEFSKAVIALSEKLLS